jgi:hypothetical protein
MSPANTYFEQISVEMVKRIAKEFPNPTKADEVIAETPNQDDMPQQERWREVAQKVQVENDPQKVTDLVEELLRSYDEEKRRKSGHTPHRPPTT